jgi:hypothetical protein
VDVVGSDVVDPDVVGSDVVGPDVVGPLDPHPARKHSAKIAIENTLRITELRIVSRLSLDCCSDVFAGQYPA